MALLCRVQQFNGYYGCPHCYLKSTHENHRMLYPVSQGFVIRKNSEYNENAKSKVYGVKALSPLSQFFGIPRGSERRHASDFFSVLQNFR